MAIAQAQLNQLVNSEHGKPFAESKDRYMDDVPSEDGHLKLLKCSGSLEKAQIHQNKRSQIRIQNAVPISSVRDVATPATNTRG